MSVAEAGCWSRQGPLESFRPMNLNPVGWVGHALWMMHAAMNLEGKTEGGASHRRIPKQIHIAVLIHIESFWSAIAGPDQPVLESNGSWGIKRPLKGKQTSTLKV